MKYLGILLLALIAVAFATNTQTENKSKTATENKAKVATQIGSNSFYRHHSAGPLKKAKKGKKSKNGGKNKKKKPKVIKIKRKKYADPIKILKDGWLKVSSSMFKHTGRFPPIVLPNGKEIKIVVDKQYFRINQIYSPGRVSPSFPPSKKYFWFRLSGKNLYYSMTRDDMNVLGVVTVKNIIDSFPATDMRSEKNCFRIKDRELRAWNLCAENIDQRNEWICKIKEMLGLSDKKLCSVKSLDDSKVTVITKKITQPVLLIPLPSPKCNESWDYVLKGQDWNCECSDGMLTITF